MIAAENTRLRGATLAAQRRREDLAISVGIIVRSVPAIDDLIRAMEGAGGCKRLVGALRSELAARRGGARR